MGRWEKTVSLMVGGAVLFFGALAAPTLLELAESESPFDGLCAPATLGEFPAPDRAHTAVVFQMDCGATTTRAPIQVSVLEQGEEPSVPGNVALVLVPDDRFSDHILPVKVDWTSSLKLRIQLEEHAKVEKTRKRIGSVSVAVEGR